MILTSLCDDATTDVACCSPNAGTVVHDVAKVYCQDARLWNWSRSAGKDQLGGKLQGTRTWIGTTECAALLRCFSINAKIVDFEVGAH
jgi:hypothetical protein